MEAYLESRACGPRAVSRLAKDSSLIDMTAAYKAVRRNIISISVLAR